LPRRIPFSLAEITRFQREGQGAWVEGIEGGWHDGEAGMLGLSGWFYCFVHRTKEIGKINTHIQPNVGW
jgi:hypothetical protein